MFIKCLSIATISLLQGCSGYSNTTNLDPKEYSCKEISKTESYEYSFKNKKVMDVTSECTFLKKESVVEDVLVLNSKVVK